VKLDSVKLERLYKEWNRRERVSPDPVEFLYGYDDPADREIAGLIASCLAYGRVAHIVRSVGEVLDRTDKPARFLRDGTLAEFRKTFVDFKHRFTTGEELAALLTGIRKTVRSNGSLETSFLKGLATSDQTVRRAASAFVERIAAAAGRRFGFLLPSPADGSACKRLNLFLKWMVRHDNVDPGGWDGVPASKLIYPLDTHIFRIGRALGLTNRKQADGPSALEVTEAFREIAPDDPVRYDFALMRLSIRAGDNLPAALADLVCSRRKHIVLGRTP